MVTVPSKATLTSARRRLLELMQFVNFGRIENLVVRGGEPSLVPPPRIVREVKFGGDNNPRPELATDDFRLKAQVVELFRELERLGDGTALALEVKHGLPFRLLLEGAAS